MSDSIVIAMDDNRSPQIIRTNQVYDEWFDQQVTKLPRDDSKDWLVSPKHPVFVAKLPEEIETGDQLFIVTARNSSFCAANKQMCFHIFGIEEVISPDKTTSYGFSYREYIYSDFTESNRATNKFMYMLGRGFSPLLGSRPHYITHYFPYVQTLMEVLQDSTNIPFERRVVIDSIETWVTGFEPMLEIAEAIKKYWHNYMPCGAIINRSMSNKDWNLRTDETFQFRCGGSWIDFTIRGHCLAFVLDNMENTVRLHPTISPNVHHHFLRNDINLNRFVQKQLLKAADIKLLFSIMETIPFYSEANASLEKSQ